MTDQEQLREQLRANVTLENIANYGNAFVAHANAKRGKKHYGQVKAFEHDLKPNLDALVSEIAHGTYHTGEYRIDIISDGPKQRIVGKVPYRDRVAQWMFALVYEPLYMTLLHPNTHAAIPGRGIHSALHQVEQYLTDGYTHVLKLDVAKFFPSINRTVLKMQMSEDIADRRVLEFVSGIIDDAPMSGIPIGNYLSQFFANRYLTPFDEFITAHGFSHVRYMDDIVIFGRSREELIRFYRNAEWFLNSRLYLEVKENWQVFEVAKRGIDFVGYRIWNNRTILRKSTFANMRVKCRNVWEQVHHAGILTDHARCVIMSYLGWVSKCSPHAQRTIYDNYFARIISASGVKLTKTMRRNYKL